MSIWYTSVRDFVLKGRNPGKQGKIFFPCGVQQLRKKKIKEKEEIAEAEKAEYNELYDPDPVIKIELCGEYFHIRKSFYPKLLNSVADDIEEWIQNQRDMLSEEEYLKLLCNYKNWMESAL